MVVKNMNKNINYFVKKDKKSSEVIFVDYNQDDGYKINPKTKKADEIKVNKIVFVSPTLSEKLIRKKIEKKINYFLNILKIIEEEDSDPSFMENTLMEAEKLRIMIINNYVKYLGHTYHSLTLKKIQIIINELKIKIYKHEMNNNRIFMNFEAEEEIEEKRGRGR